jgi:hypothetical protein
MTEYEELQNAESDAWEKRRVSLKVWMDISEGKISPGGIPENIGALAAHEVWVNAVSRLAKCKKGVKA